MRQAERVVVLRIIDSLWVRHLTALDDLARASASGPTASATRWSSTRSKRRACSRAAPGDPARCGPYDLPCDAGPARATAASPRAAGDDQSRGRSDARQGGPEDRPQRSLLLRQRQEVQVLPRSITWCAHPPAPFSGGCAPSPQGVGAGRAPRGRRTDALGGRSARALVVAAATRARLSSRALAGGGSRPRCWRACAIKRGLGAQPPAGGGWVGNTQSCILILALKSGMT